MKGEILAGRILIDPEVIKETTDSGILIPGNVNKRPTRGKVVLTGKSLPNVEMEIKVGADVIFGEGTGQEVEIDEKKYLLMEQRNTDFHINP